MNLFFSSRSYPSSRTFTQMQCEKFRLSTVRRCGIRWRMAGRLFVYCIIYRNWDETRRRGRQSATVVCAKIMIARRKKSQQPKKEIKTQSMHEPGITSLEPSLEFMPNTGYHKPFSTFSCSPKSLCVRDEKNGSNLETQSFQLYFTHRFTTNIYYF